MDHLRSGPWLSSLSPAGEFATALRERIEQARDLLDREPAEVVDEIGVRAARSRLAYLSAVAADHGVDVHRAGYARLDAGLGTGLGR